MQVNLHDHRRADQSLDVVHDVLGIKAQEGRPEVVSQVQPMCNWLQRTAKLVVLRYLDKGGELEEGADGFDL